MSNEPQSPPPLRLKPRLSGGQAVTASEPAPDLAAPPKPVPTTTAPLAPLPVQAQAAPPPLPPVNPAPLPPEKIPAPLTAAPAPAAEDPGKFKLKPRMATPAPVTPSSAAATEAPAVMASAVAASTPSAQPADIPPAPAAATVAKPTLPAAALASPAFAKPPVLAGRPNMPIAPLPAGPAPLQPLSPRPPILKNQSKSDDARAGRNVLKLLLALLFVAAGVFGVLAYNLWFSDEPVPAPITATKPAMPPAPAASAPVDSTPAPVPVAEAPTPVPAPPVVVDNPQSLPGQLVAKARDAVAAHDAALTKPANDVIDSAPSAPAPVPVTPPADVIPAPVAPPAPAEVQRPEPSANFKAYVVNLKINGVFQGENARAMLNGKMYRLGELIDPKLGIVFLRLEPEDKRIVFEDAKGAIMSRRY